jgi:hypothetical protein
MDQILECAFDNIDDLFARVRMPGRHSSRRELHDRFP